MPVGEGDHITLPGGRRYFEVLEKLELTPAASGGLWDARPAVHYRNRQAPLTIRSLRALLLREGVDPDTVDAWTAFVGEGDEECDNVQVGLKRDALKAMGIRVKALLDSTQDAIMRLPLQNRIAVLGPPGTGKTTTLIKRLRHKLALMGEPDEQALVAGPDASGLDHATSWLLFSPTPLLREYVREAFGKADIPVHNDRLHTWDDYSRSVGRRALRFLSDGNSSGGLIPRDGEVMLLPTTLNDQIAWFEAFDAYQRAGFVEGLRAEAERLAQAADPATAMLGRQIADMLTRYADRPLAVVTELAALALRLRDIASAGREDIRRALVAPLREFGAEDAKQALVRAVEELGADEPDDIENEDVDTESAIDVEEIGSSKAPVGSRQAAGDAVIRVMRARAIAQANGRAVAAGTRARQLLDWIAARGVPLPDLKRTGQALLVQRAATRLARAPADLPARVSLRYRQFRRAMREQGEWYAPGQFRARDVNSAEVDVITLATLRLAGEMEREPMLARRLAGRTLLTVEAVRQLRRNQILVDEATDFSPVQLACMRELADPRTGAFFLSGDFNQRLTRWGSRSEGELRWVSPDLRFEPVNISYRQSRRLATFASALGRMFGLDVQASSPEHLDHEGFAPVLGEGLNSIDAQATWLAARIGEVNRLTDGALPTVAVLVCDPETKQLLANALNILLAEMTIRAVACSQKERGLDGDVRVFEVEHVKGLEFEAVFFVDIDQLLARDPAMFGRYLYVGATRAATFLGITCRDTALPAELQPIRPQLAANW